MLELILLALVTTKPLSTGCGDRCPCIAPPGGSWQSPVAIARAERDADAVFRGHVIRVDTLERDTSNLGSDPQVPRLFIRATVIRYTFAVQRSWKGPSEQQLVVTNYAVDTSCGRVYKSEVSYLVRGQGPPRR